MTNCEFAPREKLQRPQSQRLVGPDKYDLNYGYTITGYGDS